MGERAAGRVTEQAEGIREGLAQIDHGEATDGKAPFARLRDVCSRRSAIRT